MIHIALEHNRGFAWTEQGGIWTKCFIYREGECVTGQALCAYFRDVAGVASFREKLAGCNGSFSVIISRDDVLLACDPVRIFPLFYVTDGKDIFISDSAENLVKNAGSTELNITGQTSQATLDGEGLLPVGPQIHKSLLNESAAGEFLATGYVTGKETLVRNLFQVQAGEIIDLSAAGAGGTFYATYQADKYSDEDYHGLADRLERILEDVFSRLIKSVEGCTVVVPLSGGYDSRLIAAMLKKLGYSKVICYTYGRPGGADIEPSKKAAGILGWPWIYVEYNQELIKNYLTDPEFIRYYRYSANLVSMFFLQEYFAVRYLTENKLVPDDSVFVPGHSGDFIAGSMFLKHHLPQGIHPGEEIAKKIFDVKYSLCRPSGNSRNIMLERISQSLQEKVMLPDALAHTIYEDWDVKEKFAKFIVNSCNVYSWFGYEYRLPFWDREFVEFFRKVPHSYKVNKRLYDEVLVNSIFNPLELSFEQEVQPAAIVQKFEYIKSVIRRNLPFRTGRPMKNDPLLYRELTQMMVDDLKGKGIDIRIHSRTYNSLIVQWYLKQLFGN